MPSQGEEKSSRSRAGRAHLSLAQGELFVVRTRGAGGLDAEKLGKKTISQPECQRIVLLGNRSPPIPGLQGCPGLHLTDPLPDLLSPCQPSLLCAWVTLTVQAQPRCPLPSAGLGVPPPCSVNTLCFSLLSLSSRCIGFVISWANPPAQRVTL